MRQKEKYKIIIAILACVILLQWLFMFMGRPKVKPRGKAAIKGKIAIVLDDWGYNLNNLDIVSQIKYPLTVSVLPGLSFSARVARELNSRGLEVILHLPMEPQEKYRLEKDTIKVGMEKEVITDILNRDLESIVYARGVSNHMGSKATEDTDVMGVVFRQLKKKRLYFLDSFVSADSVGADLATKFRLGFARRDVFLDNNEDPEYIKQQIYKLKSKARANGYAIGIGHDRRATLEVLKEQMPLLAREGYKFVFVSELVR
ncbi:MAG: divergent polysaccharide deacetylase family protein [Candidatus Omnitrophica bacterium]|nr:divergent polysaccharide deacetylase family protein [Candidatus Omnitrophota bacterium]